MKTGYWMVGLLLLIGWVLPVDAEFYRYTDKHGNILFTDDLNKVPPDQRAAVKSYESSRSAPQAPAKETQDAGQPAKEESADTSAIEKERHQLNQRQETLKQEYEGLMVERAQLDDEKNQALTNAQIKEYNKKIVDFNAKIHAYEVKRDALTTEMKAFNDRVSADSKGSKKE